MYLTAEGTLVALILAVGMLAVTALALGIRAAGARGRRASSPSRLSPRMTVRLHVPAGPPHRV